MTPHFFPVIIDELRDETPEAFTLFFQVPDESLFQYLPGQYLTVRVQMGEEAPRRAFSLSSSPHLDKRLSVTIKRVAGGRVSNYIRDELKAGDQVEIMPPMGNFTVSPDPGQARHYILIGAGSGITPLMSILKTILAVEPESKVSLWYGNRKAEGIIFAEQLQELGKQYGERLHVRHILSQAGADWQGFRGRLDQDTVYQWLSDLFMEDEYRKVYYLCGPQGMMDAAEAALEKHAVPAESVHREYYSAPVPTEAEVIAAYASEESAEEQAPVFSDGEHTYKLETQSVKVVLDDQVHSLPVNPDQHILDAAIAANLDPPFACQSGICTTCRAMLVAGVVSMDETEGLSEEELQQGYVLTCQAHPLSEDVEVSFG